MFLKILGFLSFFLIVSCNKGKVDFEQCGCVNQGNRRQYLVEARVNQDQIADFIRTVVDLQSGIGGSYGERVRIDGLCAEIESSRVVFCAEDRRDYQELENTFPDISFYETSID